MAQSYISAWQARASQYISGGMAGACLSIYISGGVVGACLSIYISRGVAGACLSIYKWVCGRRVPLNI